MALLQCQFYSAAMAMGTSVRVILPDTCDMADARVLYLLHGLSDDSSIWSRYTSIERYVRGKDIAVIMPEVQRSWYCDMKNGLRYFTYISQELPQLVHKYFGLSLERENNYIAGLSMGGFGAMKTALTYPERYAGVGSFSGAVDLEAIVNVHRADTQRIQEAVAILGPELAIGPENDLKALVKKADPLPKIYLSCGEEDFLYGINQEMHRYLEGLSISHGYDHRPGDHNWDFWDQSIRDCMAYWHL